MSLVRTIAVAAVLLLAATARGDDEEAPWERRRREMQDAAGGLPPGVLALQSDEAVVVPGLDEVIAHAREAAAEAARPLIDTTFHDKGRRLVVPEQHATIQAAIDAAAAGDTVIVRAGVYHELLTMKDGVRLASDAADGGDELVAVEGARTPLPRRALRTVVDGSKSEPSRHGLVDFTPGTGRHTIVDGFTFRSLPAQNHHVPGHAHALNVRGASPVIMNCLIEDNGSTGIGNHVVYADQSAPLEKRDFRHANIAHEASAVIYRNVLRGNLGLGIGCNHFSSPHVLGNEILANDDSALGEDPSPGVGAKHGATPTIIGNVVHDNPGGGILAKAGAPQGAHPIDRRTRPTVRANVVFGNGTQRAGIACAGGGTRDEPVRMIGNWVFDSAPAGIGISKGTFAAIEENLVVRGREGGIAVHGSTALELSRNRVAGSGGPGYVITAESHVRSMVGNAAADTVGPRFLVRESEVATPQTGTGSD